MTARRAGARLRLAAAALIGAGCAAGDDGESRAGDRSDEPTVFTDSALFRELCLEADSGLTVAAGRCTPRHQGNPIP